MRGFRYDKRNSEEPRSSFHLVLLLSPVISNLAKYTTCRASHVDDYYNLLTQQKYYIVDTVKHYQNPG